MVEEEGAISTWSGLGKHAVGETAAVADEVKELKNYRFHRSGSIPE